MSALRSGIDWQSRDRGFDSVTASKNLGHADIKMTMRYAHPTPENKRKAVEVLATVLKEEIQEKERIEQRNQILLKNSSYVSSKNTVN